MLLKEGSTLWNVQRAGWWGLPGFFYCLMTGPVPLPKIYPANLWLCYRGVRYRPAALQLFVANGGWGGDYRLKARPVGVRAG